MQARGGLNAMIDERQMSEYYNGLMGNKTDVIGGKTAFLGNSVASRQEQATAQKELALQESKAFESLAEAETAFKSLAAEFPVATTALQALAAAATAAAVAQGAMSLLGKGGGALKNGVARTGLGRLWQGAGQGLQSAGSRLGNGAKGLGMPRMLGAAGLMLYSGKLNEGESKILQQGKQAYLAAKARGETQKIVFRQPERVLSTPKVAASLVVPNPTLAKPAEPPEKLTPVITQQTTAYQTSLATQTSSFQAALQADTAAVSGKLDAINGTLSSLQQTIQLTSTLNLDGRIIANEVSRHAVAMFGRGAAQ